MPAEDGTGAGHAPRRARYLIPKGLPRRAEFLAACAVVLVLAHALFAQLTLVVAVACYLTGKATRWRVTWLLIPVLVAVGWMLAIGPRVAVAGFTAGPAAVAGYLTTHGDLLHPLGAFAGARGWLGRQLPLALGTGAAEAAIAAWLSWLHTDEPDLPRSRPGLLAGIRRVAIRRAIRNGSILTRDGACLGVAVADGSRVELTWTEAERGVLVCGSALAEPLATSLQLVAAALRRRKPVLALDTTAGSGLRRALAECCATAGVPLRTFGGSGLVPPGAEPCCYEPFRYGDPAQRAALVTAMLHWEPSSQAHRRRLAGYLTDVFELLDAVPGDQRVPVLDEVIHLLDPLALRARARHVPASHPRRASLTSRLDASADVVAADPGAIGAVGRQLRALRAATAGRWLGQPVGANAAELDFGKVVASRSAALFCLDAADEPAGGMLGRLVLADLRRLAGNLPALGVPADALVWLACPAGDADTDRAVGELIAAAPRAGLAVLVTAISAEAAFTERLNALAIHQLTDMRAAQRLAALAGPRVPAAGSGGAEQPGEVSANDLLSLTDSEFMLAVARPRRLIRQASAIRADRGLR